MPVMPATAQIQTLSAPAPTNGRGDIGKIKDVAHQFEAVLLTSLLGPLQKSFSSLPGANSEAGSGEYQSLETQALASGLAAAGGLGIANMIVHNLLMNKATKGPASSKVPAP
jgi:Rod binding domain-containing protein